MMNNIEKSLVNLSAENLPDISMIENTVDDAIALLVFAHGAGADKSSDFMQTIAELLNAQKINVLRFNFGYMDKRIKDNKRYPPERMPTLLNCFKTVLSNLETSLPLFLAGKSMGGRVAATLVENKIAKVKGVVCLGYPFHPQKKTENLRLTPLQNTTTPILIVQGERDALGNKQEIEQYRLSSLCQVAFLADGDHDLKPRVKSGFTHQQHMQSAVQLITEYISHHS
ncbi:alpha/beta hydrolase [Colwellia sp. 1_MG-2023]|uniref:alpha/beta family hydrolase n=1 Tax=Colwellia sp. 1_MG-2023 TaxID=3062649 RepID=UPI0026E1CF96|nr:alpha/beta family hydrolase [Colwellia sp. 1_MG-2023]MDO6446438.1 alpha/beta hydrolase [Colwellia sp. 1_MG-2023]